MTGLRSCPIDNENSEDQMMDRNESNSDKPRGRTTTSAGGRCRGRRDRRRRAGRRAIRVTAGRPGQERDRDSESRTRGQEHGSDGRLRRLERCRAARRRHRCELAESGRSGQERRAGTRQTRPDYRQVQRRQREADRPESGLRAERKACALKPHRTHRIRKAVLQVSRIRVDRSFGTRRACPARRICSARMFRMAASRNSHRPRIRSTTIRIL